MSAVGVTRSLYRRTCDLNLVKSADFVTTKVDVLAFPVVSTAVVGDTAKADASLCDDDAFVG